jgi:diguanylate cyclase (GGDEF)-like protein/PAS domain S-box-containing protein
METDNGLQASEQQYRLLFDRNPHPMWVYALDTLRFLAVNAAAIEHYGYTRPQFLGMTVHDLRPAEDVTGLSKVALKGLGKSFRMRRHRKRNGAIISVAVASDNIIYDGYDARLVLAQDVTDRLQAEVGLQHLNRLYATLSRINGLLLRVKDRDQLFTEACRIVVEAGTYAAAWIGVIDPQTLEGNVIASDGVDQSFRDLIALTARADMSDSERPCSRAVRECRPVIINDLATDPSLTPYQHCLVQRGYKSLACLPLTVGGRTEGVITLLSMEVGTLDEKEVRLLLELSADISFALDHLKKQERLHYLAYHDELTGLANRASLVERVGQYVDRMVDEGRSVALGLIDLERFKNINHSLGRPMGDALLKLFAEWLTHQLGDPRLLARVDADQFAVIVPLTGNEGDPIRRMEGMLEELRQHTFSVDGTAMRVAAKAGVTVLQGDTDVDIAFRNVEAALRKAKMRGDRCVLYTHKMNDTALNRLGTEFKLREAIDKEQFLLHYQPKVRLLDGKLTGVEALIRWNDPQAGLIAPGRFIPILEETGLIRDVGRWVLHRAVADYQCWRKAGHVPARIAVNVSALQLRNRDFIDEVKQAIDIDPQAAAELELEITESMIMEDVERTIATLKAIRDMGVSVAIDDFGTGFSSLSYLAKLPVDALKVDRSFVNDMVAGADGVALVSTIINLAHSLKLKVVAEGVETQEQARLLLGVGCDEVQGYLYGRPVAGEIFEERYLLPGK